MKTREEIILGCEEWAIWWYGQRIRKLKDLAHSTMSTNPFLLPFLMAFHGKNSLDQLASLNVASHLMAGHHTGFGKLIDEKILPEVFSTSKLDANFRRNNGLTDSCFDDVDHIVQNGDKRSLLSLKASRWTIQLGQALTLNRNFSEIQEKKRNADHAFDEIVIGVFYGDYQGLTDKYYLACGIKRTKGAANHDLIDVSDYARVLAGRDFWSWLNGGEADTDSWVLSGLTSGFKKAFDRNSSEMLLDQYGKGYEESISDDGEIDIFRILRKINS
jgi:hypothetical protein